MTDVMKLGILKRGEYPGLSTWAQCNHGSPYKRESRQSAVKKTHEDEIRDQSRAAMRQGI